MSSPQAGKRVEIDPEAADKLKVCRADFMHAFENDIKPVGSREEASLRWCMYLTSLGLWCEPRRIRYVYLEWHRGVGTTGH